MESDQWKSILDMLGMDNDSFKNGTNCCCTIRTNANRCKSALNGIRDIIGRDDVVLRHKGLGREPELVQEEDRSGIEQS